MLPTFLAILGILIVLAMVIIGIYNKLVALRQRYKNAFAQIDVQLKRRYDLIHNLVETVKGYMKHEKETSGTDSQSAIPCLHFPCCNWTFSWEPPAAYFSSCSSEPCTRLAPCGEGAQRWPPCWADARCYPTPRISRIASCSTW